MSKSLIIQSHPSIPSKFSSACLIRITQPGSALWWKREVFFCLAELWNFPSFSVCVDSWFTSFFLFVFVFFGFVCCGFIINLECISRISTVMSSPSRTTYRCSGNSPTRRVRTPAASSSLASSSADGYLNADLWISAAAQPTAHPALIRSGPSGFSSRIFGDGFMLPTEPLEWTVADRRLPQWSGCTVQSRYVRTVSWSTSCTIACNTYSLPLNTPSIKCPQNHLPVQIPPK